MTTRHRRRARRRAVLAAGVALAATLAGAVSCAAFGTGVDDISYVAFDGIPFPALIAGDTLRDSLGVARPLRASAYDASGGLIVDAPFTYLALDTGVVVDANGYLLATTRRDGLVRVVASLDGLQSEDRSVRVTRRPDSLFAETAASVSLNYKIPDVAATNLAPEMRVHLVSNDTVGVGRNVGGWLVRWRAIHGPDTLGLLDTTLVALQTSAGLRRLVDTTSADGVSSRRLRVFAERLVVATDSFVVLADVRRYGTPVPGSPVRFVVRIAPP